MTREIDASASHKTRTAGDKPALRYCVLASVAVHLAMIGCSISGPAEGVPHGSTSARGIQAHLVARSPAQALQAIAQSPAEAATAKPPAAIAPPSASPLPMEAPAPQAVADDAADVPAQESPALAAEGDYLPRRLLTRAPEPVEPIVIPSPISEAPAGRYAGVLSLFIDEFGQVQQVRLETTALPREMEMAAREAFLMARFTPGEVDGHPVRAKLRIEVVFEHVPPLQEGPYGGA